MVKCSPYHAEWEAVHYIQNRLVSVCVCRPLSEWVRFMGEFILYWHIHLWDMVTSVYYYSPAWEDFSTMTTSPLWCMGDPKGFISIVKTVITWYFSPFHRVLLCTVRSFSVALCKKFFEEKYFSKNLWQLFFSLCTTFITQPSLKVEELSDYKRYKSLTRCVRVCTSAQTHNQYESLALFMIVLYCF